MNLKVFNLRKLWLSLLLLVGATAIAIPGIQEVMDGNVAKVGNTEYATIEEAVAAWGPGKTLTLLDNVTTTSTVTVEVNATKSTQNWTLDLGDYTWTASGCNAFQLYAAGGTVMNQNYGLKIYANQNGGITASGKYCIECKYDNSTAGYRPRLEIHGGTYSGSNIIYYASLIWNSNSVSNGPSTHIFKSNDGTEPVFNGNFALAKCPLTIYAGYFNGTSFNTYPVSSTANTNLNGGHFKTISAFPSPNNNKGIIFGNYKVFVKSDASIDVVNGAPATYEAKATKTLLLSSNQGVNYSDYVYYEKANDALNKYSSGTIEIILSEGVTATQDKSFRSGTLTIDATAEGSAYTGNITLTSTSDIFIIKFPEGKGHYGVTASTGQLHVEETVADGFVTRTYSVQNVTDPEAKVGDTGYSTVYDAFYAIDGTTDNKTIVLQKDVTNAGIVTNGTAVNAAGKTVATFDLNGKSIGIGSVAAGNNADYTLTIIDSSQDKTGTVTNSDASLFILALTGINDYSGSYTLKIQAGTWQFDPSNVVINGETHNLVDEGYVAKDNGDGTWTVGEVEYVAKIGNKKYTTLQAAFNDAIDGDVVELLKDYDAAGEAMAGGSRQFVINKSITFDGGGYTLTTKQRGIGVGNVNGDVTADIDVTIKNVTVLNTSDGARCIDTRGMIGSLTLDGVTLSTHGAPSGYTQPLTIGGNQTDAATVTITNSTIQTNDDATAYYAIITFNPVKMNITNSTIKGWANIFAKGKDGSAGSASSVFNLNKCTLVSTNEYSGTSNAFGAFVIGDNNVTVNVTNSDIQINSTGDQWQTIVLDQGTYTEGSVNLGEGNTIMLSGKSTFAYAGNNLAVSGGISNVPVPEEFCAEGMIPTANTNSETMETYPYSVKMGQYVAQIGEKKYETLEAAFAAVEDGETIKLLADCAGNGIKAPQGKFTTGITVDFDGHTYTMDGSMVGSTGTETQAIQLLKDNKITFKNGTIYSEKALMLIQNYCDLTLEGMTLTLKNENYNDAYTLSNNNGNIVIDGTTINANPAGSTAFDVCRYSSYTSVNVTVKGESVINGDIEVDAGAGDPKEGMFLTVEAGTINGNLRLTDGGATAITDHAEKAAVKKNNDVTLAAPADYKWKDNGDGTSTLVPCEYVAQIGTKKYESLEEAWNAVNDGETIKLLADCAGNGIKAQQGKFTTGITVDFDGHTYTMDGSMVGSTGTETQAFQLLKDNRITFKDGTIYSEKAYMLIQNYSDLTLEGMTLTLKNENYNDAYTLSNNNGNIVIDGTTINANPAGSTAFDVCRYSSYASVNVTVKGESVINGDIEVDAGAGDPKEGMFLTVEAGTINGNLRLTEGGATAITDNAEKAAVKKNNDVTLAAPADYKWKDNGDGTSTLVPCEYVAQIGTKKYESLEEAWAEVKDGETIKLLADCAGNGIKAPQGKFTTGITVDFDGHTYTMDGSMVGSTGTENQAFQLLKDNRITFKNGTIYSEKALMLIQNYSDLTLEGMTLTLKNENYNDAYTLSNNNGNIVIDGTTINANPAGSTAFDVCRYSSYTSVNVTVKGESVINGDIEVDAGAGDPKEGMFLTVEAGTINGNLRLTDGGATAITDHAEKAAVKKNNNVTLAAPADYKWKDNGDGTSTLVPCEYVAQIGEKKYESLEAAWAEVKDGETIKLLADCAGNGIKAQQGKFTTGITVDFDGHTYTMDGSMVGSTGTETQAFQLLKDNKITFKGGTIYSEKAYMLIQNYSDLTLEGMTLTLKNENYNDAYTLSNNNGNIVIDGTTINANPAGSTAFDVCRYSSYTSVNVTVKGESVINGDIEVDAGAGDPKEGMFLTVEAGTINGNLRLTDGGATAITDNAEKAAVKKNNDVTLAAPADYKWKDNGDGTSTLVPCEYICAIGTTKYETLAEAVAAAGTAETTITLLTEAATDGVISGDGVVVPSGSNITFDLNGLTYNVSGETVGSSGTKTSGFQLLKDSDITFKNGTLKATSPTAQMLIQNYSNLTLEDVSLDGTALSRWAYALSNNCGTINLTGSTSITAKSGGRAFDTCKFGSYAIPTVNINTTGAITGPIEATGGKLNIENGKFDVTWVTDNNYAAGDIQIKGGVFAEEPDEEYCADGYVVVNNEDEATKDDYPYTVMSKEDAGIFELLDWEPYPYKDDTADRNATSITYKRKFPSNNYNAWYVPFDYNITEEDLQNFDFYKFHMISASSSTGNANVNNVTAAYIHLQKITTPGTKLRGNSPYVIVLKNAVDETAVYEFKMEGDNLKLLKPNNNSAFQMMSADFDYDFFGTYDKYGASKPKEWFALNSGRLSPNNKAGASINQYRWVLKLTPRGENSDYSKIDFGFIEDEDATGLSTISADEDNQIEGIYSVNGSKHDNLEKGINIIRYKNGTTKKVIIK